MTEILFLNEKQFDKTHTLTVGLNMDGHLVFDDGEYFPALDSHESYEVADYLTVHAGYKKRLLHLLGDVLDGVSETCGVNDDERLLSILERAAHREYWKSLGEIEEWLQDRGIPFTKQRWVDTK
ncbi:MAG: hypothetical protein U0Z26_02260 [Anaerolineales bacterium]